MSYTASSASVSSVLDNLLRHSAHHNRSELPGSVLVPVTGSSTKQLCMFHHLVCWFDSVVCSKLAFCGTIRLGTCCSVSLCRGEARFFSYVEQAKAAMHVYFISLAVLC